MQVINNESLTSLVDLSGVKKKVNAEGKRTIRKSAPSRAKVLSFNEERSCWQKKQGEGGSLDLISSKKKKEEAQSLGLGSLFRAALGTWLSSLRHVFEPLRSSQD